MFIRKVLLILFICSIAYGAIQVDMTQNGDITAQAYYGDGSHLRGILFYGQQDGVTYPNKFDKLSLDGFMGLTSESYEYAPGRYELRLYGGMVGITPTDYNQAYLQQKIISGSYINVNTIGDENNMQLQVDIAPDVVIPSTMTFAQNSDKLDGHHWSEISGSLFELSADNDLIPIEGTIPDSNFELVGGDIVPKN